MKLRNKKTGEIVTFVTLEEIYDDELNFTYIKNSVNENELSYSSLKKFNDEWEDYVPKEPLIKDEKIRKAVRAWAEALKENTIRFDMVSQGFSFGDVNVYSSINFDGFVFDLVDGKKYTIDELCGEEKE